MKTITHKCPSCGKPHALVWYYRKGGKAKLAVICNASLVLRHKKGEVSTANHTSYVAIDPDTIDLKVAGDLTEIPKHYTPEARKAAASKDQNQLPMMLVKEGEQVERSVSLPRYAPSNKTPNAAHEQKLANLKLKIDQRIQAAKELDDQIIAADKKRRDLREQAQKLGAELSVLQTSEFKLSE